MAKTYFITGTDTEVGKTYVTELLLKVLRSQGQDIVGLKPIASDSHWVDFEGQNCLINSDALSIYHANQKLLTYKQINPLVYQEAIAPHIAAERSGQKLSVQLLNQQITIPEHKTVLIEGAGGWLTPLNQTETYADWVATNGFGVILVVGMKLGCLNHAQLTVQNITAKGLKLVAWIANRIQADVPYYQENLNWLKANISAPMLAEVRYQDSIEAFSNNNPQLFNLLDN